VTIPVPIWIVIDVIYIILNPGYDGSTSTSYSTSRLQDINGDGFLDFISSTSESQLDVSLNRIGRSNLLQTVSLPLGGSLEFDYKLQGNTADVPFGQYVLQQIVAHDGMTGDGADEIIHKFQFLNGYYDRFERQFYGYDTVIQNQIDSSTNTLYRNLVSKFNNKDYYLTGLCLDRVLYDANQHKYDEYQYTYQKLAIPGFSGAYFPALTRQDVLFYEGGLVPKQTYLEWTYDPATGNPTYYRDAGETFIDSDDYVVNTNYSSAIPLCNQNHIWGIPIQIKTTDLAGNQTYRYSEVD